MNNLWQGLALPNALGHGSAAGNALVSGLSLILPDVNRAPHSASTYRLHQPSEIIAQPSRIP